MLTGVLAKCKMAMPFSIDQKRFLKMFRLPFTGDRMLRWIERKTEDFGGSVKREAQRLRAMSLGDRKVGRPLSTNSFSSGYEKYRPSHSMPKCWNHFQLWLGNSLRNAQYEMAEEFGIDLAFLDAEQVGNLTYLARVMADEFTRQVPVRRQL